MSELNFEEMVKARPKRGTGAPVRSLSHKAAILALLIERGETGVLGSELYNSPEKFGRSPRNRIGELRKEGHLIEGRPEGPADWFYRLIRDNNGAQPQTNPPETAPSPSPYMDRIKQEHAANAPLFAGVQT